MPPSLRLSLGGDSPARPRDPSSLASLLAPQLAEAAPGAKLPTTRSLALQLGCSPTTVATAYQLLADAALIARSGRDGRGFAVADREAPGGAAPRVGPPRPDGPPPPELLPVFPANRPARGTPGYLTLSSAFLDPRLAPRDELAACLRRALRSPGLATYADAQGYLPLRQLIAQRLRRAGIAALPEHLLLTIGSQHALDLVVGSLVTRRVATEDPSYLAARALLQRRGLAITPLPIEPFGAQLGAPFGCFDPARWRGLLAADRPALAYLTSSFQNPTGASYTSRELLQILEWSRELGFGILEDDWAEGMLPHGERKPTLRGLGGASVLYMNAFTKKTLPSLRVGFVAGDERTLPSLLQAKKLSINGSPALLEEALCDLIAGGHYDAYLQRAQREVAARYRHCLSALRALMPRSARWTLPGGGPLLWLELPRHVDLEALIVELAERKVLVSSQRAAFAAASRDARPHLHGLSLGYAFPDRDEMTRALEILADCLRRRGA